MRVAAVAQLCLACNPAYLAWIEVADTFFYYIFTAASLHIEYPMLFKVSNNSTGRTTHCGVLEFIAQEGHVYLPRWVS